MRITESRLRKLIRNVIRESYMTDDGIKMRSYEEAESEILKIVQDKTLVSDSLNQACEDISNGNKGAPENVIRRKIAEHAMRYLMKGTASGHVSADPVRMTDAANWKSEVIGWLEKILWKVDNFTYEMPKIKSKIHWKYYNFSCHVDSSEIPDVSSIRDLRN